MPPTPPVLRALLLLALTAITKGASLDATAPSEAGRPLVRTFTRQEHKAHAQFHAPFQSPEGLMYFGNQLAVMEYDGRSWRVLKIPLPFTRALAPGPTGDIYVGDDDQIGVLARPDSGEPRFRSLLDRVPADAKPFGVVRDVRVWRGDIFFATDKNLLRYRERSGTFDVWPFSGPARNRLFAAGERLILHRQGEGLYEFADDRLTRIGSAPEIARPGNSFVVAAPQNRLLLGLGDQGLFTLGADGALARFPTEADAILQRSPVLTAQTLRDGALAIGTVAEGVVLLSPDGKLLRHLTRETGLPHATVFALAEDREGALWVGTNNAPARILWRSAATVFDHQNSGLTDARATAFQRHRGIFYYLSNDGLYRLVPASAPNLAARFERDARVDVQTRLSSLLSHPTGGLLLAGGRGLQRLTDRELETLSPRADGLLGLSASESNPARVFFAHPHGIGTGTFAADGTWRDEGDIAGIDADCYDVFEDAAGTLWTGTTSKGVIRATRAIGATDWRGAAITRLTVADGLPEGHGSIFLWDTSLGILFDTARGIYRFDPASDRFVFHRELTAFDSRPLVLNPVARGADREIWTNGLATDIKTKEAPFPLVRLRAEPNGKFSAALPPPEIQDFFSPGAPYRLAWEEDSAGQPGVLWAKGDQGLLRIDLARYSAPPPPVAPLVRAISAEGRDLVFPGAGPGNLNVHYSREPLTITWVSGLFRRSESERFQTRLAGFNDTWTPPTMRNDIAFTNLEGGPFRFEVRNVDRQGQPGPVSSFSFSVTPPWPRSRLAYAVYSVIAVSAMFGVVRWRLRHGERERARLEALVAERTTELAAARDQADSANRAKSVFLASMSHELRTPLNGVIGYAQVLMKDRELSEKNRERLRIVQNSGEHLLRMINEVLDFSKIEAGRMELNPAPFHLQQLLRDITAAMRGRAEQKGLAFAFELAPELPEAVVGDAQKIRQVIDNLLANAIKFTTAGSVTLRVACSASGSQRSALNTQLLHFRVTDTGTGVSAADRARIFQPFEQAAEARAAEPGTGLGLPISQRFVALMGGTLELDSAVGAGSTFHFTIRLPAATVAAATTAPTARVITGCAGPRRTVLIVDDVAVNRSVLVELLQPLGFQISEAASAEIALTLPLPELAVLDLRLPGMDGLELARRLRAGPGGARLKLIAMSASVLQFKKADADAAGCDDFLPKPFRESDLLALIAAALGLEWSYAEPAHESRPPPTTATATQLTATALTQLLGCARRGEILALRECVARLHAERTTADAFLETLDALARSYSMERIRELLERELAARPAPSP